MRQGVICMLIAALVLQLAGGVVAGGAEPLAMTTQETIRTVAVSGVPTALMRGARLPERMPSFHTDAACHLADSWQSWSAWYGSRLRMVSISASRSRRAPSRSRVCIIISASCSSRMALRPFPTHLSLIHISEPTRP